MKTLKPYKTALSLIILLSLLSSSFADVRLPHVISANMVLQRDVAIPIWGWADPCETIKIKFDDYETQTKADTKGNWQVKLPAKKAGGPFKMIIAGKNTIELPNILVGEVWLCSGQSNMVWGVLNVINSKKEIAEAGYPQIRLFSVPNVFAGQPAADVDGAWAPCQSNTVAGFSAVAYFFGRELHKQLNVPIGLINASWNGSGIDAWTSADGFAAVSSLQNLTKQIEEADREYRKIITGSINNVKFWVESTQKAIDNNSPLPSTLVLPRHPLADTTYPVKPTVLFNAQIHPLASFAIRGAIWYQGESNVVDGPLYTDKMKALITGWRKVWGQGDFPFYYVQIAPWTYTLYGLDPLAVPKLWEAQTAALAIANTGMVVTTDIGDINNIHPFNKQAVGKRLALWALAKTYNRPNIVYSGPIYKSMSVEGNKIRIRFDYVGSGLVSRYGKALDWFEIAGTDKNFVKAKAIIDGDTIIVSSKDASNPVAVRFGWYETAQPNLINKEGLPASPFRTDNW